MLDQLTINCGATSNTSGYEHLKSSYDDFMASLASRKIKMPAKKQIKETVPFSNKAYDFSDINGEAYWEERELEYTFEITAETPERLEELKLDFADWIMNIKDGEIHDPFIPDYHFKGTYESMDFEDDEGLDKTTVTVTFLAYPYKIANLPTVCEVTLEKGAETKIAMYSKISHRVTANYELSGLKEGEGLLYQINSHTQRTAIEGFSAGKGTVIIPKDAFEISLMNVGSAKATLKLSFYEEVF